MKPIASLLSLFCLYVLVPAHAHAQAADSPRHFHQSHHSLESRSHVCHSTPHVDSCPMAGTDLFHLVKVISTRYPLPIVLAVVGARDLMFRAGLSPPSLFA